DGMSIELVFYSEITDAEAERTVSVLRAAPNADVTVRINSPGGSVAAGLAIYNALRTRKPTVYIDGVAASIASLIAMAGASIVAAANALIMVHDPWGTLTGNARDFRKTA